MDLFENDAIDILEKRPRGLSEGLPGSEVCREGTAVFEGWA